MICNRPDCNEEAVEEIQIFHEWFPFCGEHVQVAEKIVSDTAMRIPGAPVLVHTLNRRPLSNG